MSKLYRLVQVYYCMCQQAQYANGGDYLLSAGGVQIALSIVGIFHGCLGALEIYLNVIKVKLPSKRFGYLVSELQVPHWYRFTMLIG